VDGALTKHSTSREPDQILTDPCMMLAFTDLFVLVASLA